MAGRDDCWNWNGSRFGSGYGRMTLGNSKTGKLVLAHRFSWELAHGEIPDGLQICHSCDNPSCVNPSHLLLGTVYANASDRDWKGRGCRGSRQWKAKLEESDVRELRREWDAGKRNVSGLARRFGIGRTQVRRIVSGESWRWMFWCDSKAPDNCSQSGPV